MKGISPSLVTKSPLIKPQASPHSAPQIRAKPKGIWNIVMVMHVMPPVSPTIEPTDRSIPPMMMTNDIPIANSI